MRRVVRPNHDLQIRAAILPWDATTFERVLQDACPCQPATPAQRGRAKRMEREVIGRTLTKKANRSVTGLDTVLYGLHLSFDNDDHVWCLRSLVDLNRDSLLGRQAQVQ